MLPEKSEREIVERWAQILEEYWKKNLKRKKIGDTGELRDSFKHNLVLSPDGSVKRVQLAFLFYGRMVDMGVGKGTNIEKVSRTERADKVKGKRHAKRWYSGTLQNEVRELATILQKEIGGKGINILEQALDNLKVSARI